MTQDDRMETITDPAAIRASDEPDERGDFPCCTTPAPVGAAVALDLDAVEAEFLRQCGGCDAGLMVGCTCSQRDFRPTMLALVAEVRRLTSHADGLSENLGGDLIAWAARAEAAEAEVVTLRARLAAVEALVNNGQTVGWIERDGDVAWIAADAIRAALATTREGEHVAREVFTADGIPFVRCSCTNAKSPTSFRWLTDWLIRYDPDDGEPYGEVCDCEIGDDHYATGEGE